MHTYYYTQTHICTKDIGQDKQEYLTFSIEKKNNIFFCSGSLFRYVDRFLVCTTSYYLYVVLYFVEKWMVHCTAAAVSRSIMDEALLNKIVEILY